MANSTHKPPLCMEFFYRSIPRQMRCQIEVVVEEPRGAALLVEAAEMSDAEAQYALGCHLSVKMLANLGIPWFIIGHSNRRQFFNESNESVAQTKSALALGRILNNMKLVTVIVVAEQKKAIACTFVL